MNRKFVFTLLALIFAATPVYAKNVIKIGRDINIYKNQRVDNAVTIGSQITVSGLVENNVVAVGGSVVLTSEAVVRGNVICIGGVVARGNGAQVYGNITEVNSSNISDALSSFFYDNTEEWSWLADIIYFSFFALLFSLALLAAFLFPRPLNAIMFSIEESVFKSFFWGFLGILMIMPFYMFLTLSIIGIPLISLAFFIMLLAFIFGFIAVSALWGRFVTVKVFRNQKRSLVQETLIGLIFWWISGWLPFYAGMIIRAAVVATGFGGVLLTVFGRSHNWRKSGRQNPPNGGE
ncbi:MAG: hypothetical protein JW976_01330 [Syntrophaceae bacterium]|nr:hypothetical protein [Syntrophaceae bacterium]